MTGDPIRVLVTGGAGFIGSALCRHLVPGNYHVANLDKLTYSGNLDSLRTVSSRSNYRFHRADICDRDAVIDLLREEQIGAIIHLAAESHVDRSIAAPAIFLETNVLGTFSLLNAALAYWRELPPAQKERFRFLHVSTDEVFGDLGRGDTPFNEGTAYAPSSPYAASKASADIW